ncbi:hypothetical protein MRX96_019498 [Rhipicephalus microplus]
MVPLKGRGAEARHYDNDRRHGGRQMRLHGRTAANPNQETSTAERISQECSVVADDGRRSPPRRDSMRGHSFVTAASVAGSDATREKRGNLAITLSHPPRTKVGYCHNGAARQRCATATGISGPLTNSAKAHLRLYCRSGNARRGRQPVRGTQTLGPGFRLCKGVLTTRRESCTSAWYAEQWLLILAPQLRHSPL